TLQTMASEVSLALGINQDIDSDDSLSDETALVPTYTESLERYNFLKSASYTKGHYSYARSWQRDVVPDLWPVNGRLLSPFGKREDPFSGEGAFHKGMDISAAMGTPVHAAADGIVYHAEYSGYYGYGKLVVIDHGNGVQTWYAHLSGFEVVPGQEVRRGQVIAYSGATGRVSSPHLHFEVHIS